MTKFGARLAAERREEFGADGYVDYDAMKAYLKTPPAAAAGEFEQKLREEINRIAKRCQDHKHGLFDRLSALETKWTNVTLWKSSGFSESDSLVEETYTAVLELLQDVDFYIDYCTLNVLAVQKLVKKFERYVGGPSHLLTALMESGGCLDAMSSIQDVEQLSRRSKQVFEDIQRVRQKNNSASSKHEILFQVRPIQDYHSISSSRSQSSSMSTTESVVFGSNNAAEVVFSREEDSSLARLLAKPLLCSSGSEEWVLKFPVATAFGGAFLAGVGVGAFWTVCEVLLTPRQTAVGLVFSSFGAITGTRLMGFSKYQFMYLTCFMGAMLGSYLFAYTEMPLDQHGVRLILCAWLLGNAFGAWQQYLPRQFVNQTEHTATQRALVSCAPLLGASVGSGVLILFQLDVGVFALVYSLLWFFFTGMLLVSVRAQQQQQQQQTAPSRDETESEDFEDVEMMTQQPQRYWKHASQSVFRLGGLGSLFVDRTVRTLVVLEVVSFYPALWGEDFFLLSLGSLLACLLGTRIEAWKSALLGCATMFLFGGPGICSWVWVESSCRNDMANCTTAENIEMVVSMADILACVFFLLELSYLQSPNEDPGPWSTLDFGSMVLLLASSVGRLISHRL